MSKKKNEKPDAPPPETGPVEPQEQTEDQAVPVDDGESTLVVAEIYHAIGFGGVSIRPVIEDPRGGKQQIIKPVRAIIPREVAVANGEAMVKIIASAPDDAKIGVIAPGT